jgi:hypothetical protein
MIGRGRHDPLRQRDLADQYGIAFLCMQVQFVAILFFTSCLLLFPDSNDTAVGAGYISLLTALSPFGYMLYRGRLPALFNGITGLNLAPIWFLYLESILPGYDAYEYIAPRFRLEAFCWISIFIFLVNLLYVLLKRPLSRSAIANFAFIGRLRSSPRVYFYLTLFTFLFPLVAFLAYYGSASVLWTAISGGRAGGGSAGGLLIQSSVGDSSSLMLPINWLWQVTPFFATVTYMRATEKYKPMPLLALACGLAVVFAFFLSGSRGTMMYVAAPILFSFFYFNWDRGFQFWVVAGFLFMGLIGVMELQVRFRGNLLEVLADPEAAARKAGLESVTTVDVTESQRDNNMYLLCLILKGYPDKYDFDGFNDFVATLANPIPRAFWPGKPILTGALDIAYQPRWVLEGPLFMGTTSLSFSVVGEAYKTRGLLGLLIYAAVYALFLVYTDALAYYLREHRSLIVGLFGMSIFLAFWGFRSFFAFITFLYPFLIVVGILWVLSVWERYRLPQ